MRTKDRGWRPHASGERKGWWCLRRGSEGEPDLIPHSPPPPPGPFPRKLYRCGHAQRRHLGRLVSRCRGEEAGFSCVAAGRGETAGSPAPACGGPRRCTASPHGAPRAPRNTMVSARGSHSIPPEKHPPSFLTRTPPSSFSSAHSLRGGRRDVVLVPLIGAFGTASKLSGTQTSGT